MSIISEGQVQLSQPGKRMAKLFAASLFTLAMSVSAVAEQITILDQQGQTRSVSELQAGSTATVKIAVSLEGSQNEHGLEISLNDASTQSKKMSATSDQSGMVIFKQVEPGSYQVGADGKTVFNWTNHNS